MKKYTVGELIKELQEYDQNMNIVVTDLYHAKANEFELECQNIGNKCKECGNHYMTKALHIVVNLCS